MRIFLRCAIFLIALTALCQSAVVFSATPAPLQDRESVILFQGKLEDASGLTSVGTVDVEAWFYRSKDRLPGDLVYAEEFNGIAIEHGVFRVPIFTGTPIGGAPVFSTALVMAEDALVVDIVVDGVTMLTAFPLGTQIAAVRAEHAAKASALRGPIQLSESDIPLHEAARITTGTLAPARIPAVQAVNIDSSGAFSESYVPGLNAGAAIGSGTLGSEAFGKGFDASQFDHGVINPALLPGGFMESGDFGVRMGMAANGTAAQLPAGFSRSQCMWMASVRKIDANDEDGIDHIQVSTDANGVVTCLYDTDTGGGPPNLPCIANYLTICRK